MIKEIREKLNLSQSELAIEIGVTQGYISHIENGRNETRRDFAEKLIGVARKRGLEISYNDIFGEQAA